MTSGGQYVMTTGTTLMLLWSVGNWDMHILEVSHYFDMGCIIVGLHLYYADTCRW